ncbi:MAG: cupin domain-containing protein [Gemmatimonadaceae bacterium]|nr:cupin domain-containing protein [Gemmatimonadaceae bacterium]
MSARADELVRELALAPHPEGGFYRELFRSRRMVRTDDGRSERWAATTIFYLLRGSDVNKWHRVASDEIWHWYEGAPLELHLLDPQVTRARTEALGPVGASSQPVRVVPAACWQAVRCTGEYTLAGCTVAPGFEFSDFRLLRDVPELAERLKASFPQYLPHL